MGEFLSKAERARLRPAEEAGEEPPIPDRDVSSGEFLPGRRTGAQRRYARRLTELAEGYARRRGMPRRGFLRTASGAGLLPGGGASCHPGQGCYSRGFWAHRREKRRWPR